jgi:hypothetical protein
MFYEHLATTIATLHPKATWQRDEIISKVWRANASGQLTDEEAQELHEQARPSRQPVAVVLPGPPKGYFIQRSPEQRSPDRAASIARRRRHAASGPMPPALASRYTTSEQAVCRIVADEFLAHGVCDLSRNEIASRAGVSHAMAKRTLLKIESDEHKLIEVERRPRSGRKHLTNLTRIVDRDWLAWLARGNRKAVAIKSCTRARPDFKTFRGVKKSPPRAQVLKNSGSDRVEQTGKEEKRTPLRGGLAMKEAADE